MHIYSVILLPILTLLSLNTPPQEVSVFETNFIHEQQVVLESEISTYSEDDLYNLAVAVYREAGNQDEEIQMLVANVVINRVNSDLYPDTIYDVLTQHKQYGTMWKNGIFFPDNANEEAVNDCYEIARRILEGERVCPENVLFQAEFIQGSGVYKEYDGYYFCFY